MGSSGTPDPRKAKAPLASGVLPPPRSTAQWTVESLTVGAAASTSPSCSPLPLLFTLEFADKESMTQVLGRISAFSEAKAGKGQKSEAGAGEASRGYFGHNFPMTILEDFVQVHGGEGKEGARVSLGVSRKRARRSRERRALAVEESIWGSMA